MMAAMTTISGNGMPKKKIPTNAPPASASSSEVLSARLPMRMSASSTMTSTAALMPNSAPSTTEKPRPSAYRRLSASITTAPGSTNRMPAASPPRMPCSSQPI